MLDRIPKGLLDNLGFRRYLLFRCRHSNRIRSAVIEKCKHDILFWINCFCIAKGTLVVTDRGNVPIEEVTSDDLVWDGNQWVSQEGALCRGHKSVIFEYGIYLTPDHKVWTTHGWKQASERFDRATIRLPDGYSPVGFLSQYNEGRMALRVRLRGREHSGRVEFTIGEEQGMREAQLKANHARDVKASYLCGLAEHVGQMHESKDSCLLQVRRPGDLRLREMEEVRKLFAGHGNRSRWDDCGADRQQRQLRAWQLSLGNTERAGQQYSPERGDSDVHGSVEYSRSGQGCRRDVQGHTSQDGVWKKGRSVDCKEETGTTVYDLINCGPRRAFTVIDCHGDPLLVHNCFTYDFRLPEAMIPFITYPFQDRAILHIKECIRQQKPLVMRKSRDMGASWISVLTMDHEATFGQNRRFVMMSYAQDMVDKSGSPKSLFWKLDKNQEFLPEFIKPEIKSRLLGREYVSSGGTVDGVSTTERSTLGDRATAVFVDELSKYDPEDADALLSNVPDVSNCVIYNFTRNTTLGKSHPSYLLVDKAERGEIESEVMYWTEHPKKSKGLYRVNKGAGTYEVIDKQYSFPPKYPFQTDDVFEWHSVWFDRERRRRMNDRHVKEQLELDDDSSSYTVFDMNLIDAYILKHCRPPEMEGEIEYDQYGECPVFVPRRGGLIKLWMSLDSNNNPPPGKYVEGADISLGKGRTPSCLSAANKETGQKVLEFCTANMKPEKFAITCVAISNWLYKAKLCWEKQGPGEIFGDEVKRLKYQNVYVPDKAQSRGAVVPGWQPTPDAKGDLLARYRGSLADLTFLNHSKPAMEETAQWVDTDNGPKHQETMAKLDDPSGATRNHGDRVIADALCNLMMGDVKYNKQKDAPKAVRGTLEYEFLQDKKAERGRGLLYPNHEGVGRWR